MRILVDMDGVVADFDKALWDAAAERGWELSINDRSEQRHYYMSEHFVQKWQIKSMLRLIERTNFFKHLPEVPGAVDGVNALVAAGHDVWFCTKPLEANPHCRDDKAYWIRKRWPELESKLIITPNKSLIRGDILLDDAINPDWAAEAEWAPVLFRQPYNGPGTKWEAWPKWDWQDGIDALMAAAQLDRSTFL